MSAISTATSWIPSYWTSVSLVSAAALAGAIGYTYLQKHPQLQPINRDLPTRTIQPQSCWTSCNPLHLLATALSKIYELIMAPYYLLFGEKEWWMNKAPTPIHYNEFNAGPATKAAANARQDMVQWLKKMGATDFKQILGKSADLLTGWSGCDILELADDAHFTCGSFTITGKELKQQAKSLRIGYDPSIISWRELRSILVNGSKTPQQEALARGRMVSSLAFSVRDSRGNLLKREDTLPLYRVYTSNAPNLCYSPDDMKAFLHPNGKLNTQKYTAEMERIFLHFYEEAIANGDDTPVLCGFGMGAFMHPSILPEGRRCFIEALKRATEKKGGHFKKIIFADPNASLTNFLAAIPKITVTNKSCLDIAHLGAEQGLRIALFNPGDGSGIPGQYWYKGHIALEEMFGFFTSLLFSQHPHCNSLISDQNRYFPR